MSVLFVILPLTLGVVGIALAAFIWSAKSGQMDDLDTPALRVLHDDVTSTRTEQRVSATTGNGVAEQGVTQQGD